MNSKFRFTNKLILCIFRNKQEDEQEWIHHGPRVCTTPGFGIRPTPWSPRELRSSPGTTKDRTPWPRLTSRPGEKLCEESKASSAERGSGANECSALPSTTGPDGPRKQLWTSSPSTPRPWTRGPSASGKWHLTGSHAGSWSGWGG